MARTLQLADRLNRPETASERTDSADLPGERLEDLRHHLAWVIALRGIIVLLGLNLSGPLGILSEPVGTIPFAQFFNILTISLTTITLLLWWSRWHFRFQLYLQIAVDLLLTTTLLAYTRGIESPFVSFYLLIIIYSSLTLGRNAGMMAASLSAILYTGLLFASHFGFLSEAITGVGPRVLAFRISLHALGFFSVAFLGTDLSYRLTAVQTELEEKIVSLKQLRTLNERIISSIRSGLITTGLDGKIAVFNSAAEEIIGRESAVLLESKVQDLIGDNLWRVIRETDFQKERQALRHEAWIELHAGRRAFLGFSVSPLVDQEAELLGYVISFQDLTEIKRLEEEVRLKERMAAIGRMAAGIAHEIRNPLTSMRGAVEVLRSHLNPPEVDAHLMGILIRESDRLNKFVEDFLGFARPVKYTLQPLPLDSLLSDTYVLLQHSDEVRNKHEIILNVESSPLIVYGNASQLQQVFWNLAQNAIRAMPTGGVLTIRATKGDDGSVIVAFRDTGVGMTEEERRQLFQPFQSGFGGGTGLGLSIVFQILEDHEGKISFLSEKGEGTTVTLTFPPESLRAGSGCRS